jgi:DNA-binding beta-propeller fold protein YncE
MSERLIMDRDARSCRYRLLAILFFTAPNVYSQATITTVAGTDWLFQGQDIPAIDAPLGRVSGVAIDPDGNIFLADSSNHMVMKIPSSGRFQVVAGNGFGALSTDGSPATSRSLLSPGNMALDLQGNVYVAEGSRIRRITPDGTITTVAGGGGSRVDSGPAINVLLDLTRGLALDTKGNLYFAEGLKIRKVTPDGILQTIAGNGKIRLFR